MGWAICALEGLKTPSSIWCTWEKSTSIWHQLAITLAWGGGEMSLWIVMHCATWALLNNTMTSGTLCGALPPSVVLMPPFAGKLCTLAAEESLEEWKINTIVLQHTPEELTC